jgi:hypothetical protein
MTSVAEIVEQAFREANALGENSNPGPAQAREAVTRLDRIVGALYGFEVGEPLQPLPVPQGGGHPAANTRFVCNLTAATTVHLPCAPEDGARIGVQDAAASFATCPLTLDGNDRTIQGAQSLTLDTSGTSAIWFYRADLGDWRRVAPLAAGDEMPFPPEFDDYFIIALAMRLNPRYGRTLAAESAAILDTARNRMRARYRQHRQMPVPPGLLHLVRTEESQW